LTEEGPFHGDDVWLKIINQPDNRISDPLQRPLWRWLFCDHFYRVIDELSTVEERDSHQSGTRIDGEKS
jgi:hypothetical protein